MYREINFFAPEKSIALPCICCPSIWNLSCEAINFIVINQLELRRLSESQFFSVENNASLLSDALNWQLIDLREMNLS